MARVLFWAEIQPVHSLSLNRISKRYCGIRVPPSINPFMPNGFLYLYSSDWSISNIRGVWVVLLLQCFIEIPVFNTNSVDPDQVPRTAASELGLHFLPAP